jgi:16S rRNA (guanine527-N7)-methyltransferase
VFGGRLELVVQYADLLATTAVERGLIGPRETPRLWERHLLNCAVVAPMLPPACSVVDVGAGAGLPGIVLALARPDLRVTLVEPMQRRAVFLEECVAALSLGRSVSVRRTRAEQLHGRLSADAVTARALAPFDRLLTWCWPLVRRGGLLAAYRGANAADELAAGRAALAPDARACVRTFGAGLVDPLTTVLLVQRLPT